MAKPFQRGPFSKLPNVPPAAHADAETTKRRVEMTSRHFGEMRAFVRELGDGPPLLLIHGLMTTGYSWRYVIGDLAKTYRVVAPDLPGAGRTETRPGLRYDAASLADWISEFAEATGIRGCRAIGNSLGGYLSMRAALNDAPLFERLINIHSPAIPEPRYRALGALLSSKTVRRALSRVIARSPQRWVHRNVHYYHEILKSREEAREYAHPLTTSAGRANFISYLKDAVSADGFEEFNQRLSDTRFPIPLLLLYARQDPMVAPKHGVMLRQLVPTAEFQWVEDTSHFMHVDTPKPVMKSVQAFFGSP